MAITTSTASVNFNIGTFNQDTTLIVPPATLEDKLSLALNESVATATDGYDGSGTIRALFRVTFEDVVVYQSAEWNTAFTGGSLPATPNAVVTVTDYGTADEAETIAFPIPVPLQTNSAGTILSGDYIVEIKWYWIENAIDTGSSDTITYSINFDGFTAKTPAITYWYDTQSPQLSVTDGTTYSLNTVSATVDAEFVLYPPLNKTAVTTVTEDVQNVTYTSFWTGGNELDYKALLTYNFGVYNVVTMVGCYDPFTIYNIDRCTIYECINSLYSQYKCAKGEQKQNLENTLFKANILANQIIYGLGCNSDELSNLMIEFNNLTDCDCGCADSTPTQVNAPNVVEAAQVQEIVTSEATLEIDLSQGNTVFIRTTTTTEISVINITEYGEYTLFLQSFFGGNEFSFSSQFKDSSGNLDPITPTLNYVPIKLFATSGTSLLMVDRFGSDAAVEWGDIDGSILNQADLQGRFVAIDNNFTFIEGNVQTDIEGLTIAQNDIDSRLSDVENVVNDIDVSGIEDSIGELQTDKYDASNPDGFITETYYNGVQSWNVAEAEEAIVISEHTLLLNILVATTQLTLSSPVNGAKYTVILKSSMDSSVTIFGMVDSTGAAGAITATSTGVAVELFYYAGSFLLLNKNF